MGIYNRYYFIKKMYKNYIIFIFKKGKYYAYEIDKKIINNLNINYYKKIDKYKINYLLIKNLDIVLKKDYVNNNYNKYLIISLIKEIGNMLSEGK